MIARIYRPVRTRDAGFTLVELLVVMVVIGILVAIAIPVFVSQRAKTQDTAAKADVSGIGKELATHFVDGTGTSPRLTIVGDRYALGGTTVGRVSLRVKPTALTTRGGAATWCTSLRYTGGASSPQVVSYSAADGLRTAACS